ncbi:LysE family translocator [Homoserinimonas aerilata]|nr:LysE family translocator [Homoserinimonas aerilata]
MTAAALLAFTGLAIVLALTPGPDTVLTLRFALRDRLSGLLAACGSAVATIVWAVLVAVGLAALIAQSAELYRGLKIVGGLYLVYLGVQAIRHARSAVEAVTETAPIGRRRRPTAAFAGFMSTMTNPKVGLFYIAVLPQFVPHGDDALAHTMLLGAIMAAIGLAYLCLVTFIADRANRLLRRPRVTLWLERASGGILVTLGVGTAASTVLDA